MILWQVRAVILWRGGGKSFGGKAQCTKKTKNVFCCWHVYVFATLFWILFFLAFLFPCVFLINCSFVVRTMLSTLQRNLGFERYLQPFGVGISCWYLQDFGLRFLLLL